MKQPVLVTTRPSLQLLLLPSWAWTSRTVGKQASVVLHLVFGISLQLRVREQEVGQRMTRLDTRLQAGEEVSAGRRV